MLGRAYGYPFPCVTDTPPGYGKGFCPASVSKPKLPLFMILGVAYLETERGPPHPLSPLRGHYGTYPGYHSKGGVGGPFLSPIP